MEKNLGKLYLIFTTLLLLTSIVAAKELYYDSGPSHVSNCMMIGPEKQSSVIVRFTPDVSGQVEKVRILWTNRCSQTNTISPVYVTLCDYCNAENMQRCDDSPQVIINNSVTGDFQDIDVSSLNFSVTAGKDLCIQVISAKDRIYVARSGTGTHLDNYYNYGLFLPHDWYSFSDIKSDFLPNITELGIRAVISTPTTTTTTTRITTTTTLAYRGGGGGGGGGGGFGGTSGTGTCFDGIKNEGEKDVDCGGACAPCPSCSDGIQNQGEIGVDCGGPCGVCSTTTMAASTTLVASTTTTTTEIVTSTTAAPEAPAVTGLVTGSPLGGMNIFLFLLFLLLIVIYMYRGNILGGKK